MDICDIFLTEGLIKVPPDMLRTVLRTVAEKMFWMLRDKPDMKQYPEHLKAVKAEAKKWGIALPREKFQIPEKRMFLYRRTMDVADLPPSYAKLVPDRETYLIALDYDGIRSSGNTVAYFWNRTMKDGVKDAVVVVNMLKIRGVAEFPQRRTPEEVPFIIGCLRKKPPPLGDGGIAGRPSARQGEGVPV